MLSFFKFNSHSVAKLDGHTGAVISLALSPNGKLLASSGKPNKTNKILVLIMLVQKEPMVSKSGTSKHMTSSAFLNSLSMPKHKWVAWHKNEAFDTLCYGNALGWLVFLQHWPNEVSDKILGMVELDIRHRDALRSSTRHALWRAGRYYPLLLIPQADHQHILPLVQGTTVFSSGPLTQVAGNYNHCMAVVMVTVPKALHSQKMLRKICMSLDYMMVQCELHSWNRRYYHLLTVHP